VSLISPYDPDWPDRFRLEADRLAGLTGDALVSIEHIGSTSVPGLQAKPVIDLLAAASSLEAVDARRSSLAAAGYQWMGEYGFPGRRYLRRHDSRGRRTHHVHIYRDGTSDWHRHIAVRDYLRTHPEAREAYGALKAELEGRGGGRKAYQAGKAVFVEQLERAALRWVSSGRPYAGA